MSWESDILEMIRTGPAVVLVAGLPGNGKSTIASRLSAACSLIYIEIDAIPGDASSRYRIARSIAADDIRLGKSVIMAGCAVSVDYRLRVKRGLDCKAACIWIEPNFDLMRTRRGLDNENWWRLRLTEPSVREGFDPVVKVAPVGT